MTSVLGFLPSIIAFAQARVETIIDGNKTTSVLSCACLLLTGGICPGINDVIQNLVSRLHAYGVPEGNVLGIKYGVRGFLQKDCKPIVLTDQNTDGIHLNGE